ncbi:MAG: ACT domain-containing protein, partial [Lentisphaeria bacterium]|nr:ACT domain-containing protein [Lentisphaeria bacterium]
ATASAVVADIIDAARNLASNSVRRIPAFRKGVQFEEVLSPEDISSRFYLRLLVRDCPGVIASITQILADRSISISSLIQHETRRDDGGVNLVILTHPATEKDMRSALSEIGILSINQSPVKVLRIEDL